MADKPILFSGPMVRALIAGTKTQTRRAINPQPKLSPHHEPVRVERRGDRGWVWMVHTDRPSYQFATGDWKSRYAVGDRLYVREAWSGIHAFRNTPPAQRKSVMTPDGPLLREDVWFWADGNPDGGDYEKPRPAMHMPRWASRITLTVTDVRVERLQDISEADAQAEGCDDGGLCKPVFQRLWNSINGPGSWEANPWVAAYTFTVQMGNIDKMEAA